MHWITVVLGLCLGVLWLIGLNEPNVVHWFDWLLFVIAGALLLNGIVGMSPLARKPL